MGKVEVQIPLSVFFPEDQRWTGHGLAPFPCKGPISGSLDPSSSKGKGWANEPSLEMEMGRAGGEHFRGRISAQVFLLISLQAVLLRQL